MPTSQHYQISSIMDVVVHFNPQSVLDIGVGFGKYGMLCREYLELWDGQAEYRSFKKKIDGIEVHKEYLTPVHNYIYNNIFIGNVVDLLPTLKDNYDLALMIDVLEHFTKEEGNTILSTLAKRAKLTIISVPKDIGDQGELFGNPHEEHKSEWTAQEICLKYSGIRIPDRVSHLAVIGDKSEIAKIRNTVSPPPLVKFKRALVRSIFD